MKFFVIIACLWLSVSLAFAQTFPVLPNHFLIVDRFDAAGDEVVAQQGALLPSGEFVVFTALTLPGRDVELRPATDLGRYLFTAQSWANYLAGGGDPENYRVLQSPDETSARAHVVRGLVHRRVGRRTVSDVISQATYGSVETTGLNSQATMVPPRFDSSSDPYLLVYWLTEIPSRSLSASGWIYNNAAPSLGLGYGFGYLIPTPGRLGHRVLLGELAVAQGGYVVPSDNAVVHRPGRSAGYPLADPYFFEQAVDVAARSAETMRSFPFQPEGRVSVRFGEASYDYIKISTHSGNGSQHPTIREFGAIYTGNGFFRGTAFYFFSSESFFPWVWNGRMGWIFFDVGEKEDWRDLLFFHVGRGSWMWSRADYFPIAYDFSMRNWITLFE